MCRTNVRFCLGAVEVAPHAISRAFSAFTSVAETRLMRGTSRTALRGHICQLCARRLCAPPLVHVRLVALADIAFTVVEGSGKEYDSDAAS